MVSAGLGLAFLVYTWLVVHWGPFIRLDDSLDRNFHVQGLWPVLSRVDRIGQRAVCLPILAVVVVVTAWRHRSWRPAMLAGIAVFSVNLLVLIAKLAMSRGRPLSGLGFFAGGDMYPSGHTANILVVYGLCYHLITHYGSVSRRTQRLLLGLMVALCCVMFTTSLLLRWHWFSDLVGGFLIGGAVLALTVGIDASIPFRSARIVVLPAELAPVSGPSEPLTPTAATEPVGRVGQPLNGRSMATSVDVQDRVIRRRRPPGSPATVEGRRSRH